jgi:hypothetical protein
MHVVGLAEATCSLLQTREESKDGQPGLDTENSPIANCVRTVQAIVT